MAVELKRFWNATSAQAVEGGYLVNLDKNQLKTPLKNPMIVPTLAFAENIALEWAAVDGKVKKHMMPFTRIAEAALDAAATERAEIINNLSGYGATDLLCYRAQTPIELVARQTEIWDPLLDWAAQSLNAPLHVTQGIIAIDQPAGSLQRLRLKIEDFDLFQLSAFYDLVKLSGSLVIAFAVAQGEIDAKTGWAISRLDDLWQIEQWGPDDEAEALAEAKRESFEAAALSLIFLSNP